MPLLPPLLLPPVGLVQEGEVRRACAVAPSTELVASHPRKGPFSLALGLGCENFGDSSEKPEMVSFLEVTAGHN